MYANFAPYHLVEGNLIFHLPALPPLIGVTIFHHLAFITGKLAWLYCKLGTSLPSDCVLSLVVLGCFVGFCLVGWGFFCLFGWVFIYFLTVLSYFMQEVEKIK